MAPQHHAFARRRRKCAAGLCGNLETAAGEILDSANALAHMTDVSNGVHFNRMAIARRSTPDEWSGWAHFLGVSPNFGCGTRWARLSTALLFRS